MVEYDQPSAGTLKGLEFIQNIYIHNAAVLDGKIKRIHCRAQARIFTEHHPMVRDMDIFGY
jgi:ribosomal protein L22